MDKLKDEGVNYFNKVMNPLKEKMNSFKRKSLVKTWGDHNFNFCLQTQTNYEYLASNLVAEAFEQNRVPIATQ